MRLLAYLPKYPPRSRVGAWLSTDECLQHLAARGHEVSVITYQAGGKVYEHGRVMVYPTNSKLRAFADHADVILSHGKGRGLTLAATHHKPSVRMIHSLRHTAGADLNVYNSWHLKGDSPGIVVRAPIHLDDYRTTPGDRITLVNLSPEKGGELFWTLAKAMPKWNFLGVHGGYGSQLQRRDRNVEVVRHTAHMRDDVYARTRILLVPSVETWGRVGLEAMASGIPVIAHPCPGLVESLGDAATYAPRNDPQRWAETIETIDADWHAYSQLSRAHADAFNPADDLDLFTRSVEALVQ